MKFTWNCDSLSLFFFFSWNGLKMFKWLFCFQNIRQQLSGRTHHCQFFSLYYNLGCTATTAIFYDIPKDILNNDKKKTVISIYWVLLLLLTIITTRQAKRSNVSLSPFILFLSSVMISLAAIVAFKKLVQLLRYYPLN